MTAIEDIIARWDSSEGRPFKGKLIDINAYGKDPTNIGCMCAQGQVLHLLAGWDAETLRLAKQRDADESVAALLGISTAHAVLLRNINDINDTVDGAPSIVLTDPAKVLGSQADTVLAFWRHLDRMTERDWLAARDAAGAAAGDAAGNAARAAARAAAWDAAWAAAGAAAGNAARAAAGTAAWAAAWAAAGDAAVAAARAAVRASSEIQGASVMRARGQPFFFLPLFGFADPEAIIAAEQTL